VRHFVAALFAASQLVACNNGLDCRETDDFDHGLETVDGGLDVRDQDDAFSISLEECKRVCGAHASGCRVFRDSDANFGVSCLKRQIGCPL